MSIADKYLNNTNNIASNYLPKPQVDNNIDTPVNADLNTNQTLIPMVNSDGKLVKISSDEYEKAKRFGYTDATQAQVDNYDYLKQNEGLTGDLKAGLFGALDEATFGVAGAAYKGIDPESSKQLDALAEEHQLANYGGRALGFLGSMLYGGEVFGTAAKAGSLAERAAVKALSSATEKELASKFVAEGMSELAAKTLATPAWKHVATAATKYGVESAAISAPKAITEAMFGDPEEAAQTLAYGFGAGALLGGFAGGIGKATNKLAKLADDAGIINAAREKAGDVSNAMIQRSYGFQKAQYNKLGLERVEQATNRLRDANYITDKFQPELIGKAKADALDLMTTAYNELDKLPIDKQSLGADLIQSLNEKKNAIEFPTGVNAKRFKYWDKEIASLENDLPEILSSDNSFNKLWSRLKNMDENINYSKSVTTEKEALKKEIRGELNSFINSKIEQLASTVNNPEIATNLARGKELYSDASVFAAGLKNKAKADAGNRMVGLTDNLYWLGSAGHAINMVANAHPVGALSAFAPIAGKKILENESVQTRIASALYRFSKAGGTKTGLVLAADATAKAEQQLGKIPQILKNIKDNRILPTSTSRALSNFLHDYSSDDKDISTRKDEVKKLTDSVTATLNDPQLSDKLAAYAAPISYGAPKISEAFVSQQLKVLNHIAQIAPKDNSVSKEVNPFKKPKKFSISDSQLTQFEKQLAVINNPFVVLDELNNKTLTKPQVQTLQEIYPSIYNQIVSKINEAAASDDLDLNYQDRIKLSLLLGTNLDSSLEDVNFYQNQYIPQDETPKNKSSLDVVGKDNRFATEADKIT